MEYKRVTFDAHYDEEERTFKGYASTWDLDQGGDIIERGAFMDTLGNKPDKVKILWQHDTRSPIGRPTLMREDEKGLYVEGKISATTLGNDAVQLMRDGVIDSMSIGFMIPDGGAEVRDNGVRYISKVNLMEFSLVTWPMNEAAVITGVKSLEPKEIERVLREAGLSRSQAKAIATAGVKNLREADEQQQEEAEALAALSASVTQSLNYLKGISL